MLFDFRYFYIPTLVTLVLVPPAYYVYYDYYYVLEPQPIVPPPPPLRLVPVLNSFPTFIRLDYNPYQNWAGEPPIQAWVAYPENAYQIIELANWARYHSFRLRPSGSRHSSAPLTLDTRGRKPRTDRTIIVDTTQYLTQMEVISAEPGNSSFWAEPGIAMEALLQNLETKNLALASFPSMGKVSLGGALAVGAHGIGIPKDGEMPVPGHSYGSLSNLILSLTAIVYDPYLNSYALKKFLRSDPEIKALLVNFGKTFITNVTLRAGPLIKLHSKSRLDINPEVLFTNDTSNEDSFSSHVNRTGRVVTLYFPSTDQALLKTWEVSPEAPPNAKVVETPYMTRDIVNVPGEGEDPPGPKELWGTARNVLLLPPEDPPTSVGGWSIITNRTNIQRVISTFHKFFNETLDEYQSQGIPYPANAFEIRVTGLDVPGDVGVPGAESPAFSTLQPVDGRPELNSMVEIHVFSSELFSSPDRSRSCMDFFRRVEAFAQENFNNEWAVLRVEWPEAWAFSGDSPWSNQGFIKGLKSLGGYSHWGYSVEVLNKYDPWGVFSNDFINEFLYG